MDWGKWFGLAVATFVVAGIVNNRKLNPNLRLVARYAEGDLVQDLVTGFLYLI